MGGLPETGPVLLYTKQVPLAIMVSDVALLRLIGVSLHPGDSWQFLKIPILENEQWDVTQVPRPANNKYDQPQGVIHTLFPDSEIRTHDGTPIFSQSLYFH